MNFNIFKIPSKGEVNLLKNANGWKILKIHCELNFHITIFIIIKTIIIKLEIMIVIVICGILKYIYFVQTMIPILE